METEQVLCDECTDDMGEPMEWRDIPAGDRIPCERCGKE